MLNYMPGKWQNEGFFLLWLYFTMTLPLLSPALHGPAKNILFYGQAGHKTSGEIEIVAIKPKNCRKRFTN